MSLAAKIKEARAATGLQQNELAAKLGVDTLTVSRWERGVIENPRPRHLYQLGQLVDKPLSWFYEDGDKEQVA